MLHGVVGKHEFELVWRFYCSNSLTFLPQSFLEKDIVGEFVIYIDDIDVFPVNAASCELANNHLAECSTFFVSCRQKLIVIHFLLQ